MLYTPNERIQITGHAITCDMNNIPAGAPGYNPTRKPIPEQPINASKSAAAAPALQPAKKPKTVIYTFAPESAKKGGAANAQKYGITSLLHLLQKLSDGAWHSYQDIGTKDGLSYNTVNHRLNRAIEKGFVTRQDTQKLFEYRITEAGRAWLAENGQVKA